MKTEQIMKIPFELGTFPIKHKTGMGRLQDFFALGNSYRQKNGQRPLEIKSWLGRKDVKEYIEYLKQKGDIPIERVGGRLGGTWVNLKVLLHAAMDMSPAFKDEVLSTFITNKALQYRDESGDNFLELNTALEMAAESVLGKPAHKGHYITLANILKKRCNVTNWNSCEPQCLAYRTRIEDRLSTMLRAGVVKDWDHLKELAQKV